MEDGLKGNWKKVGKDFVELGADLGKTIIKTVKSGVDAVAEWADAEEKKKAEKEAEAKAEETIIAEEPATEEAQPEEAPAEEAPAAPEAEE